MGLETGNVASCCWFQTREFLCPVGLYSRARGAVLHSLLIKLTFASMPASKRVPGRGGAGQSKKTARGRSPERSVTPDNLVPDATWVDIDMLDFHGQYISFQPPRRFLDEMVCDSHSWSDTSDRSVIRSVAGAVAKAVLPHIIDFHTWRIHAANHLRRLCGSRRLFRSDTERIVTQLQERCSDLEERICGLRSRMDQLESMIFAASASTHRSAAAGSEDKYSDRRNREHASRDSPSARGRKESKRDPLDTTFEAQLHAISSRSNSPGPDRVSAWMEYASRKQAQKAAEAADTERTQC